MNRLADPSLQPSGCDCDNCRGGDLPASPFLAPRVAHGMLLGEDDFRSLIGYPRGKHLLHQAWLHGTGVVWGYPVCKSGIWELEVGRGLAIDGIGRELVLTTCRTLDLRDLRDEAMKDAKLEKPGKDSTVTIHACVVAEFDGCLSDPVPTVADPCDVSRVHDDYSRVIERARVRVRYGNCPARHLDYLRVRMLLGLAKIDDSTDAGRQVIAARKAVLEASDRAMELERQLREMACWDGIDLHPERADEHSYGWFPKSADDPAVVLAELDVKLRSRDDHWEFVDAPIIRECARTTLLPTDVITSLTAGLAPGLLGGAGKRQEGPRVNADGLKLEDDRKRLVIPVTGGLVPGTVPENVEVTTLVRGGSDRWVVEDIYRTAYEDSRQAIVVRLAYSLNERPASALVRVRVIGTGARPVMGEDPLLPLAGVVGGSSSEPEEGHDAVWTFTNDLDRAAASDQPEESAEGHEPTTTDKEAAE